MCNVISVVNQKGGVAKTTSVYNIGYSLAANGKKVLMIDFDSQSSLTVAVGMELEETVEDNIGNVIIGKKELGDVALSVVDDEDITLDIIPSNNSIATIIKDELDLNTLVGRLAEIIDTARQVYDYVLIDCPPTVADMFIAALLCCDKVIAPVTSGDYLSYVSLQNTLNDLYSIQEERGVEQPYFLGVIVSRNKKNVSNHKTLLREIADNYRVLGVVSDTDAFATAIGDGVPVKLVKPSTKQSRAAAKEYDKIAEFVIQHCEYSNKGKKRK